MQLGKRTPGSKKSNTTSKLIDDDIDNFITTLSNLRNGDFPIKSEFDSITTILTTEENKKLQLCKLLYCSGFKKEFFLHLGTIVESKLNILAQKYLDERWKTVRGFANETALINNLNDFMKKKTLDEKASDISRFDLLNNFETSDRLKLKIQSFRFLRNYGGHSKSVNEFFETIIGSQTECDQEIKDAFHLLTQLNIAYNLLLANPPSDKY